MPLPLKSLGYAGGAAAMAVLFLLSPVANAEEDVWPTLKQQTFGDRAIQAEDGVVVLEIPGTAEDASLVPLTVRVPPQVAQNLKSLTIFIDKNPDPRVATLSFGPASGTGGERSFSTRVRIDNFSYVRAVLETEDGTLHMASKFVAAAGGCGAMQAKDPDTESVDLGKMIVKTFPPALDISPIWSGQVMIKHPNSNGMQLDINTANVIPARFV
jgi:sulfur-oxidizing protein SoxY